MSVQLNTILKAGYGDNKARKELIKNNYIFDKSLSNGNNFIYYNPINKKLIHNVKGTNPLSFDDIKTDALMGLGMLKSTDRYKDSKRIMQKAKDKYKDYNYINASHSLGSSIGERISNKETDKFYGLNGYYVPFKPTSSHNGNFQHYRTQFDPISILGANKKNVKTLTNKHNPTGIIPIDLLRAHSVSANDKNNISV
jgi:hypothetical protein